jgi:drug/metabolite transporter (DMT)-like permease
MTVEPDFAATPLTDAKRGIPSGYVFAATGALLFSSKAIIVKLAYDMGVEPDTLLALRMAFSLPCYLAIGVVALRLRQRKSLPMPSAQSVVAAMLIGALGMWLASYSDFLGLAYISAQFERLILFTYPLFVVIFGALFFHQRISARALMALGVSYIGLALIFTEHFSLEGQSVLIGSAFVIGAAIAFAFYQLLAKDAIQGLGPGLFTCIAMTGASIASFLEFFARHNGSALLVTGPLLGYSILLALGATVLPSFFMNAALHRISAQANAAIGFLGPIATTVLAVLILGERLTAIGMIGTALVLIGVAWFTRAETASV